VGTRNFSYFLKKVETESSSSKRMELLLFIICPGTTSDKL
jgi:hypothetical protein